MRTIVAYLIGLVFGLGISISGMANPAKVLNFFDIATLWGPGIWDPSLALVMGSALLVTFVGYRLVLPKSSPILAKNFQLPTSRKLDAKLIGGSAVFGIGWGIAGFCPGGSLPALGTGRSEVIFFTIALIAGVFAARILMKITQRLSGQFRSQGA